MKTSGRLQRPIEDEQHGHMLRFSVAAYVIAAVLMVICTTLLGAGFAMLLTG